jgi:hypothetical protein
MSDNAACCQEIRTRSASPFEVVQFDYYDGTTEGLARCNTCGRTYIFDVLTQSNDGTRLYGFATIASAHYEAVAAAMEVVPRLDELQPWRESLALVEARVPRQQGERDLFVLSDSIESEVTFSRRVGFEVLRELVDRTSG